MAAQWRAPLQTFSQNTRIFFIEAFLGCLVESLSPIIESCTKQLNWFRLPDQSGKVRSIRLGLVRHILVNLPDLSTERWRQMKRTLLLLRYIKSRADGTHTAHQRKKSALVCLISCPYFLFHTKRKSNRTLKRIYLLYLQHSFYFFEVG